MLGLIPFIIGFLMNQWIVKNPESVLPHKLISILFLAFWVLVGFTSSKFTKNLLKSSIIVNLPAFLMLLLNMYQQIIVGQYWTGAMGEFSQIYFLPLINITGSVVEFFMFFITFFTNQVHTISSWILSLTAFLLMFIAYYLGGYLRRIYDGRLH